MKHAPLALALLAAACGSEPDRSAGTSREPLTAACPVAAAPADTVALRVTADGLLIGHGGVLTRALGTACDLQPTPQAFAMDAEGLDVDDAGNVYLMPRESQDPAVVSTDRDRAGVVRIDRAGNIERLVDRGRWIGGFAVSPEGDELVVHGCAAVGLHHQSGDGWAMDQAVSTHAQRAGGLDADAVAMGGGVVLMVEQGALLRVSAGAVETLGRVDITFGEGVVSSRCGPVPQVPRAMRRCGEGLCGLYADGVALFDADGQRSRVVSRDDLEVAAGERFVDVSGDAQGLYVLLAAAEGGARVVFVPAGMPATL